MDARLGAAPPMAILRELHCVGFPNRVREEHRLPLRRLGLVRHDDYPGGSAGVFYDACCRASRHRFLKPGCLGPIYVCDLMRWVIHRLNCPRP